MTELVFATNNAHKLEEVTDILGPAFDIITLRKCSITEEIPENEPDIEGNALAKARYVYEKTGLYCFADDTGMEVRALGGAPGVRSARYAGGGHDFEANVRLLLANLEGKEDRTARFRTVIALILEGEEYTFEGIINGRITESVEGTGGFGYDPVFIPDGYDETFAQMPAALKNEISHRAAAVRKLKEFLLKEGT